jgi:hypothetical protein
VFEDVKCKPTAMEFNSTRKEWVAISGVDGKVNIWKLKSLFIDETDLDKVMLDELGSVAEI